MNAKILFLLYKYKINKKGLCPIKCRITFNKSRKEFSTGLFIIPDKWNSKQQQAEPPNKENNIINSHLSLIKNNLNQAFLLLQINKGIFDVDDVYLQYKGENVKTEKTISDVYEMHNSRMEKLVGIEYSKATHRKFIESKNHTLNFVRFQYKKQDFLLTDLNLKFLQDFDYYLKSEKHQKQITINKSIQRLRKILKLALAEGFIMIDPFMMYSPKKVLINVVFLTFEELELLKNCNFSQKRLQQVKDMFIFCCYTGLAYEEMRSLEGGNIEKGFDGQNWIKTVRKKTGRILNVPLLPIANEIIDTYSNDKSLLPIISNQKFNSYLKEIAGIVGIDKRLTHHTARKTFASTVLLYNDVPMEIVSELLGHSNMSITQAHYGKVVQKKVSEEMRKLDRRLTS